MYAVAGRSGTTAATSGHSICSLWNPAGGEAISVWQVHYHFLSGNNVLSLCRTTTKGTPATTVTPDADNDFGRRAAPSSAPVLDLGAYSVQPTKVASDNLRCGSAGAIGANFSWALTVPITVPPGTGLAINQTSAVAQGGEVAFLWEPGGVGMGDAFYSAAQVDALGAAEVAWTQLWNPSADDALRVFHIAMGSRSTEAVNYSARLVRTTARGTRTGTTMSADNHVERRYAPQGVVDTGFTVDPTMDASVLAQWQFSGRTQESGIQWDVPIDDHESKAGIDYDNCIVVPPGTGLAIRRDAAGVTTSKEVTWGWYE